MAFEYIGMNGLQDQTLDYSNPYEQPSNQQQGMSPMQGLQAYQQIAGGGGAAGATGAGGGVSTAVPEIMQSSSMIGGSSAGGGGGSGGSMLASAGPWAALAAIVIGNESEAEKGGYRAEDRTERAKDMLSGRVLEQDVEQRWLPKMFGENLENDETGLGGDMLGASQLGGGNFSDAWDSFKNKGTLSKILDIF